MAASKRSSSRPAPSSLSAAANHSINKRRHSSEGRKKSSWLYVSSIGGLVLALLIAWLALPGSRKGVVDELKRSKKLVEETTKNTTEGGIDEESRIHSSEKAYQRGNVLYRSGDLEGAKKAWQEAVKLYSKHVYAWSNLGNCLRHLGQFNESIVAHQQALKLLPKARYYYNLAVSFQESGNNEAAIMLYRSALELEENNADTHFNLAIALQESGDLDGASVEYQRTYELDPSNAGAQGNRCNILHTQERNGEAELCYAEVIKDHPDYDRAYVNLGGLLYVKGELEAAAAYYMKALEINPENAIAKHGLGALQGEKLEGASLAYLSELFDSYSASFDESLAALGYKSPEYLRRAVDRYLASPEGSDLRPPPLEMKDEQIIGGGWHVMDAGCGTGLAAPCFRNISGHLVGVDISRRMVQRAAARNLYDELSVGDMTESLMGYMDNPFDLIISADVLVYFGRLDYIMATVSKALKPQGRGLFAFTLEALSEDDEQKQSEKAENINTSNSAGTTEKEAGSGKSSSSSSSKNENMNTADDGNSSSKNSSDSYKKEGWVLRETGRYAHRRSYVEKVARKVALEVLIVEEMSPRMDQGRYRVRLDYVERLKQLA